VANPASFLSIQRRGAIFAAGHVSLVSHDGMAWLISRIESITTAQTYRSRPSPINAADEQLAFAEQDIVTIFAERESGQALRLFGW
jgi:hypothetical protein